MGKKKRFHTYMLQMLHFKQGDDFDEHLEKSNSLSAAFVGWGGNFTRAAGLCDHLAKALDNKEVDVDAQGHFTFLTPKDDIAKRALDTLVKENYLSIMEG